MIELLIRDYGPAGLFLVSFLAATLLPLSSEAALIAAVALGMDKTQALLWASCGNSLACLFNYGLGYAGGSLAANRIRESRFGSMAWSLMHRRGWIALLLSWLPLIGDPLTVLAGFFRLSLILFLVITIPLRVLRYILIILSL